LPRTLYFRRSVRLPGGRLAITDTDVKPPYAHVSQSGLAALAAGVAISLSVFLLPGSGVQPTPLLPAFGGTGGPVTANAKLPAARQVAAPRRTVVFTPVLAPPAPAPTVVQTRIVSTPARVVHRSHRAKPAHARRTHAPAPRPRSSAPVLAAAPTPVPAAPATKAGPPWGKAKGWERHQAQPAAAPVGTSSHGQGKALGHSSDHHQSISPGQAKKALSAPQPAPPKANGHDKGKHRGQGSTPRGQGGHGNQGDHGNQGHGGGRKK